MSDRVFGLDLSLATPGVVELGDNDYFAEHRIRSTYRDEDRIQDLTTQIAMAVRASAAKLVAIEDFAFSRAQKAHEIGGLSYSVRNALLNLGADLLIVPVSALKKFACGKGNAGKNEVAVGVYKRWGFEHRSDDVVDAYVLAKVALLHRPGYSAGPHSERERAIMKVIRKVHREEAW